MTQFLSHHMFWVGIGSLWLFSAVAGGMPAPDSTTGKGYQWLYSSLHLLAANLDKVAPKLNGGK